MTKINVNISLCLGEILEKGSIVKSKKKGSSMIVSQFCFKSYSIYLSSIQFLGDA